jgi:hypothetical protein
MQRNLGHIIKRIRAILLKLFDRIFECSKYYLKDWLLHNTNKVITSTFDFSFPNQLIESQFREVHDVWFLCKTNLG